MKFISLFFVIFVKASLIVAQFNQLDLTQIREWKQLDFNFPNARARTEALQRGLFVPQNNFPIDVDVDYRGENESEGKLSWFYDSFVVLYFISLDPLENSRIFVTIPRFSAGIPVTLGYVKSPTTDLQITPYPDYSWHSSNGANCNLMSSVLRVAIDDCKQLWVLDTGVINNVRKCPPQLFVFNLRTDKLVRNYKFPKTQYNDLSLFITPVRIAVKWQWKHKIIGTFLTGSWREFRIGKLWEHKSLYCWRFGICAHCLWFCSQQVVEDSK
jgi:Major royal jelly protein